MIFSPHEHFDNAAVANEHIDARPLAAAMGAEIARVHLGSCLKLFRDGARHLQPVSIEHIPDEPAAIEPGGIASAISIRDTAK